MQRRAIVRRAFPYLVIGIVGFALAYAIIYIFVLPSKILPPATQPYVPDSSHLFRPIDTTVAPPEAQRPGGQATVPMAGPTEEALPVMVPDLVGMALPDARGVLNSLRLRVEVEHDTSSFQPPNTVLRQSPPGQTKVPHDGTVRVTVSYFPPDTSSTAPADTRPVQRGSNLPPIMPAEPDTTKHPDL